MKEFFYGGVKMNKNQLTQQQVNDCVDLIDNMGSVYCDENMISGENCGLL